MVREIAFDIGGCRLAAQAWGSVSGHPVLALHGWLDNSASFSLLAPLLKNTYIVAPDLAGHGQSDHRKNRTSYNILDDIQDIFAMADQLRWPHFSLLGHSRGAIISALAAGTFPDRIANLILIEGIFPEPIDPARTPEQLATSIKVLQQLSARPLNTFADPVAAQRARQLGMFPLGEQAARVLVERGIRQVAGGYQWSTDQNLLAPSACKLTREQIAAFMHRIQARTNLILGDQGITLRFPSLEADLKNFPAVNIHHLSGGHHLHMETAVEEIASLINILF